MTDATTTTHAIIALDPLQHGGEAGSRIDRVGARHRRIIELGHKLVTGASSECRDSLALPSIAILVGPDIGRR